MTIEKTIESNSRKRSATGNIVLIHYQCVSRAQYWRLSDMISLFVFGNIIMSYMVNMTLVFVILTIFLLMATWTKANICLHSPEEYLWKSAEKTPADSPVICFKSKTEISLGYQILTDIGNTEYNTDYLTVTVIIRLFLFSRMPPQRARKSAEVRLQKFVS